MRQQIIITLILSIVLSFAMAIRLIYFDNISDHAAYYFLSIFWICGVLIVIFMINILWHAFKGRDAIRNTEPSLIWPNRRKTYRIIYPNYDRPKLYIDCADNQAKRQLEYAILDLSQNGICFIDDGSLGAVHSFEGRILFKDGKAVTVNGTILRNHKQQVSAQLTSDLGWSVILDEQRRLLYHTKPVR